MSLKRSLWKAAAASMDAAVAPSFGAPGYHARRRLWPDPELKVNLEGRTFVVTGANAGLGLATTRGLVARAGAVVMACRSVERAQTARDALLKQHPRAKLEIEQVDMGDLASVGALGRRLAGRRLDGLIHNAGMLVHERLFSPQKIELTFAVHVLGPFLLTRLLAGGLDGGGRLIFVSSGGMYTQKLELETLTTGLRRFDGPKVYAQSKRAQVILARRWSRVLEGRGIAVSAMHPGWADTQGVRTALPGFHKATGNLLRTAAQGADTIVWLAASPQAAGARGEFYFDREARSAHAPMARTRSSNADQERLWSLCMDHTEPWLAPT